MAVIADLPFYLDECLTYGDADHDGFGEFYAYAAHPYREYVVRCTGAGSFDTVLFNGNYFSIQCVGDVDRDGLTDMVTRDPQTDALAVLESPDSFNLPRDSVWSDTLASSAYIHATIGDLDVDSLKEILVGDMYARRVRIYECVGDNQYELKTSVRAEWGTLQRPAQTLDLDGDGRPELAAHNHNRNLDTTWVSLFEAVGDDSMVERGRVIDATDLCFYSQPLATRDMDHDGRTELFVQTCLYQQGLLILSAIESPSDDSFAIVWAETTYGGGHIMMLSAGQPYDDSTWVLAAADGYSIRFYRCTGNGRYERFWQTDSGEEVVGFYDLNADGRDELIHANRGRSIVRAWQPVGVEERTAEKLRRVEIQPSIVRRQGVVQMCGLPPSSEVEVVDASGRVVASGSSGASSFVLGTLDLKAGAYFIRIRSGNQSIVRKVLVVD